jgi:undecaprenyl-diphosphatase
MIHHRDTRLAGLPRNLLLASLLILVFIALALGVVYNYILAFDKTVSDAVRHFTSPQVTAIMLAVTFGANTKTMYVLVPILVVIFYLVKRPLNELFLIILSTTGSWFILDQLKELFHRPRPDNPLVPASGFSFPSGHAMMSIAFYGAVAYLLGRNHPDSRPARFLAGVFTLFILAIGISRVYLGVHYPSDVLAGFAAGGAWLVICITIIGITGYRSKSGIYGRASKLFLLGKFFD